MTYEDLVRQVGSGFHPDTSPASYANLGVPMTTFYAIMDDAYASGTDLYERALAVFREEGWA